MDRVTHFKICPMRFYIGCLNFNLLVTAHIYGWWWWVWGVGVCVWRGGGGVKHLLSMQILHQSFSTYEHDPKILEFKFYESSVSPSFPKVNRGQYALILNKGYLYFMLQVNSRVCRYSRSPGGRREPACSKPDQQQASAADAGTGRRGVAMTLTLLFKLFQSGL